MLKKKGIDYRSAEVPIVMDMLDSEPVGITGSASYLKPQFVDAVADFVVYVVPKPIVRYTPLFIDMVYVPYVPLAVCREEAVNVFEKIVDHDPLVNCVGVNEVSL